jgi:hypothetical protein
VEPECLRCGKEFHRRVQRDWSGTVHDAAVHVEKTISFPHAAASSTTKRLRHGRLDIFIDLLADFVTVVEIKATSWDAVLERNRLKLLAAHCRQIFRYVDKYLDHDNVSVCAGVIYPVSPSTAGLKDFVEKYLNDNALQVVWYDDKQEVSADDADAAAPPSARRRDLLTP